MTSPLTSPTFPSKANIALKQRVAELERAVADIKKEKMLEGTMNIQEFDTFDLGKVAKKKSGKSVVFCQPPLGPPPAPLFGLFGEIFRWKFFFFIFLMENQSIMPETDFKQKKIFLTFFFLLTIICPSQGEASRVKKNL